MRKKILGVILILIIVFISPTLNAVSDFNTSVRISKIKIKAGEITEVILDLSKLGVKGINILGLTIEYDKTKFETIEVTGLNGWMPMYNDATGKLIADNNKFIKTNEPALKITLKAKAQIKDEETVVKIKGIGASDGEHDLTDLEKIIELLIVDMRYTVEEITIKEKTSIQTLREVLELGEEYKVEVLTIDGILLTNLSYLGTGSTIIVKDQAEEIIKEYTVIVMGDITGDGEINLFDIVKLISYVFDAEEGFEWNETIKKAAKVTLTEGSPGLFDIQRIISYVFDRKRF